MSKLAEIELRHLHRALSADGDTPAQLTASGGSTTTATCAALTEADDAWNGALVRWDSGPNAGRWSRVRDFAASGDLLTFEEPLPQAVASGHLFTLFLGGKYASDQRVTELAASTLQNVTGFAIRRAAALNGEGTGVLRYVVDAGTLSWQPPGEAEGDGVDVTAMAEGDRVVLFGGGDSTQQRSAFVELERTAAELPAEDATDDVSLDLAPGSFVGRVPADEASASAVTFWPVAIVNAGAGVVHGVRAYCAAPFPNAAAAELTAPLGTGADVLQADGLNGWGASGWVLNVTKGDARYYRDRSGNAATIADPDGGVRGFVAVAWDVGDEIVAMPWVDIGLDAPGVGNVFEDPATRGTAPSGVPFSCPRSVGEALFIGAFAAGAVHVVWLRLEIPAGARPLEGGRSDLRVYVEVTEEG